MDGNELTKLELGSFDLADIEILFKANMERDRLCNLVVSLVFEPTEDGLIEDEK